MAEMNCRFFNGYKPCGKNAVCNSQCDKKEEIQNRILFIHLGALGAVVRSTGLLKAIHKQYPHSHITWVTQKPADQLLMHNDLIDRVFTTDANDLLKLKALKFDVAFVIDKSLEASGVLAHTQAEKVFGFLADAKTGAIVPSNPEARELWEIGIDDYKKFYVNKKSELQLTAEALNLKNPPAGYYLPLTEEEKTQVIRRKMQWSMNGQKKILGLNTGCSQVIPAKKLTIESFRSIIGFFQEHSAIQIVLLGGREDYLRNQMIAENLPVIQSDTSSGLRDGLLSVASCDVVFSGDSLGMHMAISQRVETLAWFGPTCAHEIDFFGKGESILSEAECSPCWKRTCQKSIMCYDLINLNDIHQRIIRRINKCQIQVKNQEKILDHY